MRWGQDRDCDNLSRNKTMIMMKVKEEHWSQGSKVVMELVLTANADRRP